MKIDVPPRCCIPRIASKQSTDANLGHQATAPGVIETYTTFENIADGVVDARVLGGIHWRTSKLEGKQVGEQAGSSQFATSEGKGL